VVCFYPANFTFVWPTELAAAAATQDELDRLGVKVIAISTDTVFSHWMGMAAPAGWQPGGSLIETGKDKIGVY
jgi:alkyl hydroperoxide reductase subunit AhpC